MTELPTQATPEPSSSADRTPFSSEIFGKKLVGLLSNSLAAFCLFTAEPAQAAEQTYSPKAPLLSRAYQISDLRGIVETELKINLAKLATLATNIPAMTDAQVKERSIAINRAGILLSALFTVNDRRARAFIDKEIWAANIPAPDKDGVLVAYHEHERNGAYWCRQIEQSYFKDPYNGGITFVISVPQDSHLTNSYHPAVNLSEKLPARAVRAQGRQY